MPCSNISDYLRIRLGHDSRILKYALNKQSCGGDVGGKGMIQSWLEQYSAEELVTFDPIRFQAENPSDDEVHEYLLLKNFLAVKAGISILLGYQSGGRSDFCTVRSIEHDQKGTVLRADIRIDALTDEIKACGSGCGGKS